MMNFRTRVLSLALCALMPRSAFADDGREKGRIQCGVRALTDATAVLGTVACEAPYQPKVNIGALIGGEYSFMKKDGRLFSKGTVKRKFPGGHVKIALGAGFLAKLGRHYFLETAALALKMGNEYALHADATVDFIPGELHTDATFDLYASAKLPFWRNLGLHPFAGMRVQVLSGTIEGGEVTGRGSRVEAPKVGYGPYIGILLTIPTSSKRH